MSHRHRDALCTALARYYDPTVGQFLTVDPDVATTLSLYGYVQGDPLNSAARAVHGEDDLRVFLQDLMDRTIADLDGTHFDIPEPLTRVEAMIAPPGGAAAAYYTGPAEDFSRPGRTWYPKDGPSFRSGLRSPPATTRGYRAIISRSARCATGRIG
jgi:hypothetical protein